MEPPGGEGVEFVGNSVLVAITGLVLRLVAIGPLGLVVLDSAYGVDEVDELNSEGVEVGDSEKVPETEVDTVTPDEKDIGGRGLAVDVQVLGPEEFGTVSIPGPLGVGELGEGAEMLGLVENGVTVDGLKAELLDEETEPEGERLAFVNGPFVDIDADVVIGSEVETDPEDDVMMIELNHAEVVGEVGKSGLVLLTSPRVEPADEELSGIELPARVRDELMPGKLELMLPGVTLLSEPESGELVVPPFRVTLGVVSDKTETTLLDAGDAVVKPVELEEG